MPGRGESGSNGGNQAWEVMDPVSSLYVCIWYKSAGLEELGRPQGYPKTPQQFPKTDKGKGSLSENSYRIVAVGWEIERFGLAGQISGTEVFFLAWI